MIASLFQPPFSFSMLSLILSVACLVCAIIIVVLQSQALIILVCTDKRSPKTTYNQKSNGKCNLSNFVSRFCSDRSKHLLRSMPSHITYAGDDHLWAPLAQGVCFRDTAARRELHLHGRSRPLFSPIGRFIIGRKPTVKWIPCPTEAVVDGYRVIGA